jgi:hypothetical protein
MTYYGSHLSMKSIDCDKLTFSDDFVGNLRSNSKILYDRLLSDGAAFLSELAFTFKNGTDSYPQNIRDDIRLGLTRIQQRNWKRALFGRFSGI